MTLSYCVLTGQMIVSSTRPDRILSRMKLRIPNLGERSFPVLERPPSIKHSKLKPCCKSVSMYACTTVWYNGSLPKLLLIHMAPTSVSIKKCDHLISTVPYLHVARKDPASECSNYHQPPQLVGQFPNDSISAAARHNPHGTCDKAERQLTAFSWPPPPRQTLNATLPHSKHGYLPIISPVPRDILVYFQSLTLMVCPSEQLCA